MATENTSAIDEERQSWVPMIGLFLAPDDECEQHRIRWATDKLLRIRYHSVPQHYSCLPQLAAE
jgi:hypothetical protein